MEYQAIILDFDGTLVNSGPGIIEALQCLQAELGMPPMTEEELLPYVGPPLHEFFPKMFQLHEGEVEAIISLYRRLFAQHAMPKMRPFPGIVELLSDIQKSGRLTCVATCKAQRTCEEQAEALGLRPYLDYICGADYASNRLDKADILRELMHMAHIDPNTAVMVGDRMYDLIGAQKVGLPTIGVSYGCGPVEELQAHGADIIIHSVDELRGILFA